MFRSRMSQLVLLLTNIRKHNKYLLEYIGYMFLNILLANTESF